MNWAHQAVAQSHQESYGQMLHELLTDTFRHKTFNGKKPPHVCDQSFVYLPEECWQ
jgi:hypothetical protein